MFEFSKVLFLLKKLDKCELYLRKAFAIGYQIKSINTGFYKYFHSSFYYQKIKLFPNTHPKLQRKYSQMNNDTIFDIEIKQNDIWW